MTQARRFNYQRRSRERSTDFPDPGSVTPRSLTPADVERAARWLRKLLERGTIYQFEVKKLAEAAGINGTLLDKARKSLGVTSTNANNKNEHATWCVWFWSLPKPQGLFALADDDDE